MSKQKTKRTPRAGWARYPHTLSGIRVSQRAFEGLTRLADERGTSVYLIVRDALETQFGQSAAQNTTQNA